MQRTSHFFQHENTRLHYTKVGSGPSTLFTFHGFGLNGNSFSPLDELFLNEYTIYHFDLFFHGLSEWNNNEKPLTHQAWKKIVESFLEQEKIDRFSLLGYSIGARFVWSTISSFNSKIDKIIVLAPDGIKTSPWFKAATSTWVNRKIFKALSLNHHRIHQFLKLANRLQIAPNITIRFAENQLKNVEQRQRVYYSWVVFRKLHVNSMKLAQLINQHNIFTEIYLGELDKIITKKSIHPLLSHLLHKELIFLKAGHSNVVEAYYNLKKSNAST